MNQSIQQGDHPVVIGWREYVSLPDWGIARVRAKVDSGARSSAIDVAELEELPGDRVRFCVIVRRPTDSKPPVEQLVEAPIVRRTRVRSSFGKTANRLIVATRIQIGPREKTVELGLVCRKRMLCRMLLGRTALDGDFVIDPGRRYVFDREMRGEAPHLSRNPRGRRRAGRGTRSGIGAG